MIDLYDGNNVMRRAMERHIGGPSPMSLRQRYEATLATAPGTQFWVWDGYQHNERRREIYPPYKMNREPVAQDIFSQIKLWREVLAMSHATQVEVYGWEADDVISTLARRLSHKGIPVRIHSNDMDYGQLEHLPNITLVGVNTKGVSGRWVPLYKAMVGDSSDNIAGIPGFGPKRWLEMEDHWPQIERAIVAGTPSGFAGLPFKPAVLAWLQDEQNIALLQAMLTITYFEDVPNDELEGGLKLGTIDRVAAHNRLTEFFL
jgi:5'-3' exonuclease